MARAPLRPVARLVLVASALAAVASAAALAESFSASYRHAAIEYGTRLRTDRVAQLHARLRAGEVTLANEPERGFLRSVLDALDVPIESQSLVFSKTSLQSGFIGPDNPRAIYFTDDVAVAWVRGAPALEVAAHDPTQGVMFYALSQRAPAQRGFQRPRSCLECHVSDATLGVPGLAVGSAVVDPDGVPYASVAVDHRTAIESRWGGWYVTGGTGIGRHVGNTVATDPADPMLRHDVASFNLATVEDRFDTAGYLTPRSDVAALMVLEHQTHMTNLLTLTGWEFRVAAFENRATRGLLAAPATGSGNPALRDTVRALVDYMLFVEEAPLTDTIVGATAFVDAFEARGPFDRHGRTLRQIDLDRRLFQYPCSYMIYTAAFDALPADAKAAVYRLLWRVLADDDPDPKYDRLSPDDRRNIVDILRDTKHDVPAYFRLHD